MQWQQQQCTLQWQQQQHTMQWQQQQHNAQCNGYNNNDNSPQRAPQQVVPFWQAQAAQ